MQLHRLSEELRPLLKFYAVHPKVSSSTAFNLSSGGVASNHGAESAAVTPPDSQDRKSFNLSQLTQRLSFLACAICSNVRLCTCASCVTNMPEVHWTALAARI